MAKGFFLVLVCFGVSAVFSDAKAFPVSAGELKTSLPREILSWKAESAGRLYDADSIFDYIDGAGEVYKAYNMRWCLSRRYIDPGGLAMILDIFDMGSSQDAFGVFTHDREGDPVNLGQGGVYRPGWLTFWKDRFFVSIYVEAETADAETAVKTLGSTVASLIAGTGAQPRIVSRLPEKGLRKASVRYLHHPIILNYHFYLADENILNLEPGAGAVLAEYERGGQTAALLLVGYPSAVKGAAALKNVLKHYLPDADAGGMAKTESGKWSAVILTDRLLVLVLESDGRKLAADLIAEAKHGAKANMPEGDAKKEGLIP